INILDGEKSVTYGSRRRGVGITVRAHLCRRSEQLLRCQHLATDLNCPRRDLPCGDDVIDRLGPQPPTKPRSVMALPTTTHRRSRTSAFDAPFVISGSVIAVIACCESAIF